ncbi:MAG: AAA family ATPase [Phycisphaerae bacterium]|nr:AAA family ATPase [Phycisphaerae bacterium]
MRTVAIINQKGGCGKTTISINLAAALAETGRKVLLADMDPQGHCALGLAVPREQIERSIYDVLCEPDQEDLAKSLRQITWQIATNFDLAPSTISLAAFEQRFAGTPGREDRLRQALLAAADQYDITIIDCPPSVGLLTFNALRSADEVIVPVETGYFCLESLGQQLETLEVLRKECGQSFRVRVVPSLYDVRTRLGREVLAHLRARYEQILARACINFNTKLKEAASLGQPITEYDAASIGYRDFRALAEEVLSGRAAELSLDALEKPPARTDSDTVGRHTPFSTAEQVLAQAQRIGKSADDLLQRADKMMPGGLAGAPKKHKPQTTEQRLAKFYGVCQTKQGIIFRAHYPHAEKVCLAGDFNGWNPGLTPMAREQHDNVWQTVLPLTPGCYRYRLVVDNRWQRDPFNDRVEANPFGELNSVVEVK